MTFCNFHLHTQYSTEKSTFKGGGMVDLLKDKVCVSRPFQTGGGNFPKYGKFNLF